MNTSMIKNNDKKQLNIGQQIYNKYMGGEDINTKLNIILIVIGIIIFIIMGFLIYQKYMKASIESQDSDSEAINLDTTPENTDSTSSE